MKIIYCIHSVYNPGGMERVLINKVRYLVEKMHWDVSIVTTDQHGRPPFYPIPEGVRLTDLEVNYSDDNGRNPIVKIAGYLWRRRLHRKRLKKLLMTEHADVVVSLYPSESSFIPSIKDGSKKVLELHLCKFFRLQYGRRGLLGLADRFRTRQDERIVRRFDRFVVLTCEDREYWGEIPSIEVIPNAVVNRGISCSDLDSKRVIAVGRLDYQKGFDRLVEAWSLFLKSGDYGDWKLDIFGQGEWLDMLNRMISEKGIQDSVRINPPTGRIMEEYSASSMLVMSSRYEGFGMVLVEAMSCGLPVISFDCKCGPRDIIEDGVSGLLVKEGDIRALSEAIRTLAEDPGLRKRMSENAKKVVDTYSEDAVMGKWVDLFTSIRKDGQKTVANQSGAPE